MEIPMVQAVVFELFRQFVILLALF